MIIIRHGNEEIINPLGDPNIKVSNSSDLPLNMDIPLSQLLSEYTRPPACYKCSAELLGELYDIMKTEKIVAGEHMEFEHKICRGGCKKKDVQQEDTSTTASIAPTTASIETAATASVATAATASIDTTSLPVIGKPKRKYTKKKKTENEQSHKTIH